MLFIGGLLLVPDGQARPDASTKSSVIREENPNLTKETLILPYFFPSESMGFTVGAGGMAKGYYQDQLVFGATVYGSDDDAYGALGGMWDYRIPYANRLFFSVFGAYGYYPRQRAYTQSPRPPSDSTPPPAGTNDSSENDYAEDKGNDNWIDFKLEYVLPIGSMIDNSIGEYRLKGGILQSGATGGNVWNPLDSGVSVLLLGQSSTYQSFEQAETTVSGDVFPFEIGYLYDNTDFPTNPTFGSSQFIAYTKDFSDAVTGSWDFLEFEASKYFDLGPTKYSKQQVLALNFWTGSSLSWEETTSADGTVEVINKPPYFEGARLGGFFRMRGYPNNRFNDRSVIYGTAEYRYTLKWNPVADVSWLRWLKMDWLQLVPFVEVGRVAGDYDLSELLTDMKADAGLGIRAMVAGGVVRFDVAVSEEGGTAWFMVNQPF